MCQEPVDRALGLGSARQVSETHFYQLVWRVWLQRDDQEGLTHEKDQEAEGRADVTGNRGSDGGTRRELLPAVQPTPSCRHPSSHVINRKHAITCSQAGPADQTPKGAEASGVLSPLLPPRASGSHVCAGVCMHMAPGAIPGSWLTGLGSPTLGQKTLLETSQRTLRGLTEGQAMTRVRTCGSLLPLL